MSQPGADEPTPVELALPGGMTLRGLRWGGAPGPGEVPALALHGWMDNAASFAPLAPHLRARPLLALDLPGHGRSSWRPAGATYHFIDYVRDLHDALGALGWARADLIGHSMGSSIVGLFAGTYPDRVRRLVFVDGMGPLSTPADEAPAQVARALAARDAARGKIPRTSETRDGLIDRMLAARPWITREACATLVGRCGERVNAGEGEAWRFTHDPALRAPSVMRLTEAHVLAFFGRITAPTLLLRARQGWPVDEARLAPRVAAIADLTVEELDGTHHLHMDHPAEVARSLDAFLEDR